MMIRVLEEARSVNFYQTAFSESNLTFWDVTYVNHSGGVLKVCS